MKDNDIKHIHELSFWAGKAKKEGTLLNHTYEQFYVSDFGISLEEYDGKRILDIGCGPRGSLEWADMASLRMGLDPLVNEYYKLDGGTLFHKMNYVCGYSEDMPFPDEMFDFVFSINSLDHVDDLEETVSEMKRVLKVGGMDVCEVIDERVYETVYNTGFRDNLDDPTFYDFDNDEVRPAILLLKMKKVREYVGELNKKPKKGANAYNNLFKQNKKLKKENKQLKKEIKAFKNRKVVKLADKLKSGKK